MELVEHLLALWTDTPDGDDAALAAFRGLYADPVRVNGEPMTVADLVARARHLHAAVDDLKADVIDAFEAPGRAVLVHRMTGRDRTGQPTDALTIDVLVVADGLITDVWVTSGPPPSG